MYLRSYLIVSIFLLFACKHKEVEVNEFVKKFNKYTEVYNAENANSDILKITAAKSNPSEILVKLLVRQHDMNSSLQENFTSLLLKDPAAKDLLFKGITFKLNIVDIADTVLDSAYVNASNMSDINSNHSNN